jgi:lipocalin
LNWQAKARRFIVIIHEMAIAAPSYGWAMAGHPNRKCLWILARGPKLDQRGLAKKSAASRSKSGGAPDQPNRSSVK